MQCLSWVLCIGLQSCHDISGGGDNETAEEVDVDWESEATESPLLHAFHSSLRVPSRM